MSKRLPRLPQDETDKANEPSAEVVASSIPNAKPRSRVGFLAGQFRVPDDFDTMGQDEIIRLFEGES